MSWEDLVDLKYDTGLLSVNSDDLLDRFIDRVPVAKC